MQASVYSMGRVMRLWRPKDGSTSWACSCMGKRRYIPGPRASHGHGAQGESHILPCCLPQIQQGWSEGAYDVVVATIAFGMGEWERAALQQAFQAAHASSMPDTCPGGCLAICVVVLPS